MAFAAFGPWSGISNGAYVVPTNAATVTNIFYRFYLTVTDTNGNRQTVSQDIGPQTSLLTLGTVPSGLQVALDGQPLMTTTSLLAVVGMTRLLAAPSPQTQAGSNYQFVLWSDGGLRAHDITVQPTNATYLASFMQPAIVSAPSDGGMILLWPLWAAATKLCAATNLAPSAFWYAVTDAPTISNGLFNIEVPTTNGSRFYRLRLP